MAIASYPESNYSTASALYAGDNLAFGQSFVLSATANAVSCKFYLRKTGSPPGDIVAKIYASTGTYGTTAKPTGSALAVSDAVSAASLTTDYALVTFEFTGGNIISLTSGVCYILTVEYASGDISNYIAAGYDATSPSHAGNRSMYTDAWYYSNTDLIFYLFDLHRDISIYDSCDAAEDISVFQSEKTEHDLVLQDTVQSSDVVTVVIDQLNISVSDNIAVTEFVDRNAILLNLADSISANDEVLLYITAPDINVGVFDLAQHTESVTRTVAHGAFTVRELPPVYAPVSTLTAEIGPRLSLDAKSPVATASGSFGAVLDEKAAVANLASVASYSESMSLVEKSPVAYLSGMFGSVCGGTGPTSTCASESYAQWIGLDCKSPEQLLNGTLYEEAALQLSRKSPVSSLVATAYNSGMFLSSISASGYLLEGNLFESSGWTLDTKAPIAKVIYGDIPMTEGSIRGNMTAPVGSMSCDTGFGDTESAEMSYGSRFSSYTLEYSR